MKISTTLIELNLIFIILKKFFNYHYFTSTKHHLLLNRDFLKRFLFFKNSSNNVSRAKEYL
ncbi:hypothetical protein BpHYR1_053810 [Brachionus plicatilis]|uniref:Uncharacterized protein n=1 Tax=Brachionus plicatilis TaxID=10195 RepID=A0A3M7TDX8_BRAPC|nr:hypothetical protein BpHYR1_053810 [Brachionus plicatilis]